MPVNNPAGYGRLGEILRGGSLTPSPTRSALVQQLLAGVQSGRGSKSAAESLAIAARPILAALLSKREEKAQKTETDAQRQALSQALGIPQSGQIGLADPNTGNIVPNEVPRRMSDEQSQLAALLRGAPPETIKGLQGAMIAQKFTPPEDFTLSPGQARFRGQEKIAGVPEEPDIERVGQRVVNGKETEVFRDKATNQLFAQDSFGRRTPLASGDLTTPIQRQETGGPGGFDPRTRSQQGEDVQKFQDAVIGGSSAIAAATPLLEIARTNPESLGAPGTILRIGNEFVRTGEALGRMLGKDVGADRDVDLFTFEGFAGSMRNAAIENQAFRSGIFGIAFAAAVADQGTRPTDKDIQAYIDQVAGSTADPQAFARTIQQFVGRIDKRLRSTARVKGIPQDVQDRAFGELDQSLSGFNAFFKDSGIGKSPGQAEKLEGFDKLTPAEQDELKRLLNGAQR